MPSIIKRAGAAIDATLGRCPKCMRQAFLTALGAWALAGTIWLIAGNSVAALAGAIVALGISALWIAHLATYAARIARTSSPSSVAVSSETLSRREIIPTFAKALGAIALATALPATASADDKCDCSKCSTSQYCCPTANGYCGCFPTACP